jgi:glycosyltransferase involved in cell wall biosynthesis
MSVYNDEQYVSQAIDSVLNQTFQNFEFIIIDDGSSDNSLEIIKSYKDARIVLVTQENMGLTKSLNKALKIARGDYIARMDSDDISHPQRFERQLLFLKSHPKHALVGSNVIKIDHDAKEIEKNFTKYSDDAIRETFKTRNCMAHGSVMMNRVLIGEALYYDESFNYAQDYQLWTTIASKHRVANLEEHLYRLRIHNASVSQKKIEEQSIYAAKVAYEFEQQVKLGEIGLEVQKNKRLRKKIGLILLMNFKPELAVHYFKWYTLYFWVAKLSLYINLKKVKNIIKRFQ